MRRTFLAALAGVVVLTGAASSATATATPSSIAVAIADPKRTDADRNLDLTRKPVELLTFAGFKAGQTVVDVFPGPYFDRLFGDVVGPNGRVFMFIPTEAVTVHDAPSVPDGSKPFADLPNVTTLTAPINSFSVPQAADIVWIRQNYHDLHDKFMGPADVPAFNAAVFKALKPGGEYIVIDHYAPDGSGLADTDTTHRIDAEEVKKEVTAAGFIFRGESDVLRNPADPRTALVFDKSIRGHTDQFVFKFRKPK
jgi:predicted methyltransferase